MAEAPSVRTVVGESYDPDFGFARSTIQVENPIAQSHYEAHVSEMPCSEMIPGFVRGSPPQGWLDSRQPSSDHVDGSARKPIVERGHLRHLCAN